jgi:cellulose synthase/poly-beta-1,6-N-acetylglucosamine synthase-like glycosyltransferase
MTLTPIFDIMATGAGVALVILTLPLVCELLLLTVAGWLPAKPGRQGGAAGRAKPRTMAVVPAHNEALLIGRCVRSLLEDQVRETGVLVVAHNCTDRTAAVARAAGAQVIEVHDDGRGGKGSALRAGLAEAVYLGSEALMVVDADSVVSPHFLATAQDSLSRHEAVQVRYQLACNRDEPQARLSSLGFVGFNILRPRGRERLGLSAGIFGNGFGFRSEVLARVPYTTTSMVEDLEYHLRLARSGVRVRFIEEATVTSEVAPHQEDGSTRQQARWEGGRFLAMRLWAPRLAWDLLHGQWHSAEPLLDLLALPLALAVLLLLLALALPLTWSRSYALLAFSVLIAHVLTAAAEADELRQGAKVMLSLPRYVAWKIALVPKTLRASGRDAVWTATARDRGLAYHGRNDGIAKERAVSAS